MPTAFTVDIFKTKKTNKPQSIVVNTVQNQANPPAEIVVNGVTYFHVSENGSSQWQYRPIGSWL